MKTRPRHYRIEHEPVDAAAFAQRQDHHRGAAVERVTRGHHGPALLECVVDFRVVAVVEFPARKKTNGVLVGVFSVARRRRRPAQFGPGFGFAGPRHGGAEEPLGSPPPNGIAVSCGKRDRDDDGKT